MRIKLILSLIFVFNLIYGQNYSEKFKKISKEGDTILQLKLLKEWELKNENDPELYVSYFNFYFKKSKSEIISITKNSTNNNSFQLTDSVGNIAGYIGSEMSRNEKYLNLGIEYINKGIAKFPKRLDMRFGKIYVLGDIENYNEFTNEIIKTIDYSDVIKNDWTWTNNEKLDDSNNFMLGSIQNYVTQLYNTGNDDLLENMKNISEAILKYYPNNIESLSNISVVLLIKKEYYKALEYLRLAEKLNPKDYVVLGNIAQAYKLVGDKVNAIKYYELVKIYGDNDAIESSKIEIEKLNKK